MSNAETRCVVLTPRGRGAIAVVEVRGPRRNESVDALFVAKNAKPLAEQTVDAIRFGIWKPTGEEVVVLPRHESIEIHCHGGVAAVDSIMEALRESGCETPEEPTAPPSLRGRGATIASAALRALADATTERTAAILMDQYQGALRRDIERVIAELDADNIERAITLLAKLASRSRLGLHLTTPWRVVFAGAANVGKSSLINEVLGYERAIVFDQPGTTRDVVTATTAIDGWPVVLSDTAGLRLPGDNTDDSIEAEGIALSHQQMSTADLVLLVVEGEAVLRDPKSTIDTLREWHHYHINAGATVVVLSKCDTLRDEAIERAMHHIEQSTPWPIVPTSVFDDWGIDELLWCIACELVPSLPPAGSGVPFTDELCGVIAEALECLESQDTYAAAVNLRGML